MMNYRIKAIYFFSLCLLFVKCGNDSPPPQSLLLPPEIIIESINPKFGSINGNTRVTIRGKNFAEGLEVSIDDLPCINVLFHSHTQISCSTVSTKFAKYYTRIGIRRPGKTSPVYADNKISFTYQGEPKVSYITATSKADGSAHISVHGDYFDEQSRVLIGASDCRNVKFKMLVYYGAQAGTMATLECDFDAADLAKIGLNLTEYDLVDARNTWDARLAKIDRNPIRYSSLPKSVFVDVRNGSFQHESTKFLILRKK